MSKSGNVGNIVDKFENVGLFLRGGGWGINAGEVHWVVESYVEVVDK